MAARARGARRGVGAQPELRETECRRRPVRGDNRRERAHLGRRRADGAGRTAELLQTPCLRDGDPLAQHDLEAGMSAYTRLALRRERGAILFVALIVLVAMSLAGIALMRSVDTNVLIAGNLAFRQGATAGGDWGVEDARAWISGNAAILNQDQPPGATFYWANWQQNLDLIGNNPD